MKNIFSLCFKIALILFCIINFSSFYTQKQIQKNILQGNKAYKQKRYIDAEIEYRKAIEKNINSIDATYNLGNALYKQRKQQNALKLYKTVTNYEKNKKKLSMAWHNSGNVFMIYKDYTRSAEAYKNALRNNPKDNETRYNLALAQKLNKKQKKQQNLNKINKQNATQIVNALIQNEKNIQKKIQEKQKKQQNSNKTINKNW